MWKIGFWNIGHWGIFFLLLCGHRRCWWSSRRLGNDLAYCVSIWQYLGNVFLRVSTEWQQNVNDENLWFFHLSSSIKFIFVWIVFILKSGENIGLLVLWIGRGGGEGAGWGGGSKLVWIFYEGRRGSQGVKGNGRGRESEGVNRVNEGVLGGFWGVFCSFGKSLRLFLLYPTFSNEKPLWGP